MYAFLTTKKILPDTNLHKIPIYPVTFRMQKPHVRPVTLGPNERRSCRNVGQKAISASSVVRRAMK